MFGSQHRMRPRSASITLQRYLGVFVCVIVNQFFVKGVSIGSSSVTPVTVSYRNETSCKLVKMFGSSEYYLKVEEVNVDDSSSSSSSESEEPVLRVVAGEKLLGERTADLTFHKFDMAPIGGSGVVVAVETYRRGSFLHAGSSNAGTNLSVLSSASSSDIRNLNSVDSRLFRVYSDVGDILSKIVHIQSGLYLKVEQDSVSLESPPQGQAYPSSMLFEVYDC